MTKTNAKEQKDWAIEPMLIVDLMSGRYLKSKVGHEVLNLDKNPVDGRFYGYCPPHDRINISKLGAASSDESISGVTVVYTTKQKHSSNREIIAFCPNATVHRVGIDSRKLKRKINDYGENAYCSYSIESDTLINLTTIEPKFVIHIADYSISMFRMQRVFTNKYPKLDKSIRNYLQNYLRTKDLDDDFSYQKEIQREEDSSVLPIKDNSTDKPEYAAGADGQTVRKKARIAKQALSHAKYLCAIDSSHKTFNTKQGKPYMEGHHLIPCTYTNSEHFWNNQKRNIDCEANIISLCPTCHRKIHYASDGEMKIMIKKLFENQKSNLNKAGIKISLDELLKLYNLS